MQDWKAHLFRNHTIHLSSDDMRVLTEGPKSLADAWRLSVLKFKYLKSKTRGDTWE